MKTEANSVSLETEQRERLYRKLPSVNDVLQTSEIERLIEAHGRERVVAAVRENLAAIRAEIAARGLPGEEVEVEIASIPARVNEALQRGPEYSLKPVINATGVILHTNLGRAPLSAAALRHVVEVARDYCNLEIDLESGERSRRDVHAERLFLRALGIAGEDHSRWGVVVVNNCAAATFLALNTLAEKREVIVSRGELVEIGGGFRVPEILEKSGATLREVGTTNRTRAEDYEKAITEQTALLLRVHQSNFSMEGFVERPPLKQLVDLARTVGVPLFEDQGTGLVSRLDDIGIQNQPVLQDSIAAGIDLVAASGDKLLGGPQCGLLVGRADLIGRIRKNPLLRALRVDKLTYAALEATLLDYLADSTDALPLMRMLRTSGQEIQERCDAIISCIKPVNVDLAVIPAESVVGGGSAPSARLKSFAVSVRSSLVGADELLRNLRSLNPPIIGRIADGSVVLDLRTVPAENDEYIANVLAQL